MSHQVTAADTRVKKASGHDAAPHDDRIKLPAQKNVKSVFEPASKIAVLGYN